FFAMEQPRIVVGERDAGTEGAQKVGELAADRSPAEHEHRRGEGGEIYRLPEGEISRFIQTRDLRPDRRRTRRDEKSLGGIESPTSLDLLGGDEPGSLAEYGDAHVSVRLLPERGPRE